MNVFMILRIFPKIDLDKSYYLIRIENSYISKTHYYYKYLVYEFIIIEFSLTNALPTFWEMVSYSLKY
jgi:hypothetical protein